MGFGAADVFLLVWKRTIFFFCLDPSLHTKTTAVLNTKKQKEKHPLSLKARQIKMCVFDKNNISVYLI